MCLFVCFVRFAYVYVTFPTLVESAVELAKMFVTLFSFFFLYFLYFLCIWRSFRASITCCYTEYRHNFYHMTTPGEVVARRNEAEARGRESGGSVAHRPSSRRGKRLPRCGQPAPGGRSCSSVGGGESTQVPGRGVVMACVATCVGGIPCVYSPTKAQLLLSRRARTASLSLLSFSISLLSLSLSLSPSFTYSRT